jgi:ABC-type phosphate transport system substrate-binding protein
MKRITLLVTLMFAAAALTACGSGSSVPIWPTAVGSELDSSHPDALSPFLATAMGSLRLDGTDNGITKEQAAKLLPLWQALRSSIHTGGMVPEEINDLLLQIEGEMTGGQIAAINTMQITQSDMRTWATANGVSAGVPSPSMIATQQAMASTGQLGKGGEALLDAIVDYLELHQ